ncbi:pyridoxal phosphate-dependent aminotransferase [Pseudovibrio sp. SPO723]|uniref:pyridoxal phosphate-dependent aminotransferase n=1 Tax=Nesiotobacter zosterae TaxID=392721 RepID=UPI0029C479B4|nr:aminotransferase class I/II-fold pyridoxal phosphate-dependent enzyme [Pseudovibrio sp. SPO723]MDX5592678.1 aminotransferase class I/II-fold pyridoxal phosphate-dependent enzyme [Pseudovibrio sp. SPO723]
MDVMAAANKLEAEGARVLHMEVGQPGMPVPDHVRVAAEDALASGKLGYTEARGMPILRNALIKHYAEHYGVDVADERIVVTTGSSAGFNLAFLAAFDPGDRVALTAPGYPAYRNILKALGLIPVEIEVGPETRWALTPEHIEKAHAEAPLKGVLVASPANPTGTMMTPEALKDLVEACEAKGIWFISDEIYHGLSYEVQEETALRFSQKAIIINSFSKYYCMTGWRIGWMILPEELVRPVERIAQSLYISAPQLSQIAAAAAFEVKDDLERVKAVYQENRAILLDGLAAAGFDEVMPVDGAFYAYVGVRKFSNDSLDFCKRMLEEISVASTPGADFDPAHGAGYMRFSFAGPTEDIREAMTRLKAWTANF